MTEEEFPPEPANGAEHARSLFDRAFDVVYDFCLRLLLNPTAAAAATEDALARSSPYLLSSEDAVTIRVLLFREVLRAAAEHSHQSARPFADAAGFGLDRLDPERLTGLPAPTAPQWAATAWEVLSRVTLEEYALLDLHLRQGFDPVELAAVYGVSRRSIGKRLEKLERETQRDIAALVTARQAAAGCDSLNQALLDLPLSATIGRVKQVVENHCRSCPSCVTFQQTLPPPLDLFRAMATVAPPAGARESVWKRLSAAMTQTPGTGLVAAPALPPIPVEAAAQRLSLRERLSRWKDSLAGGWSRLTSGHNPLLPLAATLFVIGTAAGIGWGTGMFGGSGGTSSTPTPTRTPVATRTITPTASPSPTDAPSATPTEEASPTAEPTATAPPTIAPPTDTPVPPASPTTPSETVTPAVTGTPMASPSASPPATSAAPATPSPTP
jgi:hypothetical protein